MDNVGRDEIIAAKTIIEAHQRLDEMQEQVDGLQKILKEVLQTILDRAIFINEEADMPKKVAKVELSQDVNVLIADWKKSADALAEIKSQEQQLRVAVIAALPFDKSKLEGVESLDIGWGWRIKATKDLNVSATNESQQTEQLLDEIGRVHNLPDLAMNLVRWKPDIAMKPYRELMNLLTTLPQDAPLRVKIAAAITVKPGMPQLEMVPPKDTPAVESNIPVTGTGGTLTTDGTQVDF
jgi:hypothetical protein